MRCFDRLFQRLRRPSRRALRDARYVFYACQETAFVDAAVAPLVPKEELGAGGREADLVWIFAHPLIYPAGACIMTSQPSGRHTHRSGPAPPSLASNLWVLVALLALLALTAGSAFIPMGMFNTVVNLAIAIAKALLVMVFYMRLKSDSPLFHIVAAAGFAWLALLIALALADLLTRVPLAGW